LKASTTSVGRAVITTLAWESLAKWPDGASAEGSEWKLADNFQMLADVRIRRVVEVRIS
jgi:hypothetical protein